MNPEMQFTYTIQDVRISENDYTAYCELLRHGIRYSVTLCISRGFNITERQAESVVREWVNALGLEWEV